MQYQPIQGQPLPSAGSALAAAATQTQAAPGAAPLQLVPPHPYGTPYTAYGTYYPYYYAAASYHQRAAQHASLYLQQAAAAAAAAQYTGFSQHYLPYLHYQYGSPHTYYYISGISGYVSYDQVAVPPAASPAPQQQFFYGPAQSHNQYLQNQYQFYAQLYYQHYLQYAQKKRKLNTQASLVAASAGSRSTATTASTPEASLAHVVQDEYAAAAAAAAVPNATVNEEGHSVYKIPCLSCRRSHSKCDRLLPYCTRCIKKGMRCEYPEAGQKRPLSSMFDESSETPSYATSAAATVVSLATSRQPTQLAPYLASVNGRAPAYDAPALRRPSSPNSNYMTKALYRLFIRTPGMVTSGYPIPHDDVKPPAVVHVSASIVDFICNTYYSCIWLSDSFIPRERLRYLLVRYMVWEYELQKAIKDMGAASVLALGQFGQIPCSVIANGVTKPAVLETVNIPGSNAIEVRTSEIEEENSEVTLEEMALLYAVETFALQSAGERALAKHYFMRSKELLDIVWNNTMQSEEYGRLWTKVQLTRESVLLPAHSLPATLRSPYPSTYYSNMPSDIAIATSPSTHGGYSDVAVSTPSSTPSVADAAELIDLIIESNPANMRLRYIVAGMWLLAFYYLGEGYQRSAYLLHHNVRFYLKYLDDAHMKTAVTLFDRFDGFLDMIGATDRTMRNQMYLKFRATRFPGLANAPYLQPYGGDPGLVAFQLMYSNDAYASRENIEKALLSFEKSFDAYEKLLVGEFFLGNDVLTASQTAVIENTLSLVIKGIKMPDLQFMLEKAKERLTAAQQRQHEQITAASTYTGYYTNDGSTVSAYAAETTISVAEGEKVVEALWLAIVREADLVSDYIDLPTFPLCPFVSSFGVFAAACVHTYIAKQLLAQGLRQERQLPADHKSPVELLYKELKALDLLATRYSIVDQLFGQESAKMNEFVRTLQPTQEEQGLASRPASTESHLAPRANGYYKEHNFDTTHE